MLKHYWLRAIFGLTVAMLGQLVNAQDNQYRSLNKPELNSDERKLRDEVLRKGAALSDPAKAALKKHLGVYIATMTQTGDANDPTSRDHSSQRKQIAIMMADNRMDAEARKFLVDQLVNYTSMIAAGQEYSPAARVNCAAVLADIDDVPADSRTNKPPKPSGAALMKLVALAEGKAIPDYVKAVALFGIKRHAQLSWSVWPQNGKAKIGGVALTFVNRKPATALETDIEMNAWLVRRGYEILEAAGDPIAAGPAVDALINMDERPSVRLAALKYLSQIDASKLDPQQKSKYVLGTAQLLRSQLVAWYQSEDNRLKGRSGAGAASYYSGEMAESAYAEEPMDFGVGALPTTGNVKPIESQKWDVRLARRLVNAIAQSTHVALDGKPSSASQTTSSGVPLTKAQLDENLQSSVTQLVSQLDDFQSRVNDPALITDMNSMLSQAEEPIEQIMEFVVTIPGFAAQYPSIASETDDLESLTDKPAAPAEPAAPTEPAAVDAAPAVGVEP